MRSNSRRGRVVLQRQCNEHVVEEAPPTTRPLFHHRQIVGREHRDAHDAEQVAGTAELLAVHQHAVAPVAAQLEFDQDLAAIVVHDRGANDRAVGADADHGLHWRATEAVERGQIGHRLGEVGLALSVQPDDCCRARLEVERRVRVVAKVDQLEPRNDHVAYGTRTGINRYR